MFRRREAMEAAAIPVIALRARQMPPAGAAGNTVDQTGLEPCRARRF
jgi:hypothetical protein